MDDYKFRVEFLKEANGFLNGLHEKAREKILYNIWKARCTTDKTPQGDIEKAERLRAKYFNDKNKRNENL